MIVMLAILIVLFFTSYCASVINISNTAQRLRPQAMRYIGTTALHAGLIVFAVVVTSL